MSDAFPLFEVPAASESSGTETTSVVPPRRIDDAQIARLRAALDAKGLHTTEERRAAVEQALGRSVDSLRSMTETEGLVALTRLAATHAPTAARSSSWEDREEDTWIDRL